MATSTAAASLVPNLRLSALPVALNPMPFRLPSSPEKTHRHRRHCQRSVGLCVSASGNLGSLKGSSGVLERPAFDQSQFDPVPEAQEGGDIGRLIDKRRVGHGDSYKVLLIDDARHTENLVEKALPKVVPSVTVNDARKLFHESRHNGVAVVIVTVKEHAEFYAQMMIQWGLRSAIEPDSNVA